MPFSDIDPVYNTRLSVRPGDVTVARGEDVTVTVDIEGIVPKHLRFLLTQEGAQSSRKVPVDRENGRAEYTFSSLPRSLSYAVRGEITLLPSTA